MSSKRSPAELPVRAFSVQWEMLGQRSYGQALRKHFAREEKVELESSWLQEDRELWTRILFQVAGFKIPSQWVARRNLDFRWYRRELCYGLYGRRLVSRRLQARRPPPDVLHFNTQKPAYASIAHMQETPTVITTDQTARQVMGHELHPEFLWTGEPNYRRERQTLKAASHVVFWSEWARRSAIQQHRLDPGKTRVIAPGVPVREFDAEPEEPVESSDPFRILFVGNDIERKGGNDLLDVFAAEFSEEEEVELHLVTGADVAPAKGVHVHRGVQAYTPAWFRLYREADVFVLPTHFDAFGLVYVEAQAAGLPVIGTNVNAVPEIVKEGETGLLVPPGDRRALATAIRTLQEDETLRRRLGAQARIRATEQFDNAKQFGALADVFVEAAGIE